MQSPVSSVDGLASCPLASRRCNIQILRVQLDVNFLGLGQYCDRHCRCVDSARSFSHWNSLHAMALLPSRNQIENKNKAFHAWGVYSVSGPQIQIAKLQTRLRPKHWLLLPDHAQDKLRCCAFRAKIVFTLNPPYSAESILST